MSKKVDIEAFRQCLEALDKKLDMDLEREIPY